ncbi:MAG: cell division protein ZapA [Gammaproteobacteria bacterium]
MSGGAKPVSVTILDKEYLIACEDNEHDLLHHAVEYLNVKMQDVKNSGKVIGSERIAVMTALNITHELLAYKEENDSYTSEIDTTIRRLQHKINDALVKGKQIEIQ